jgi:hypothetical protein
MREWACAYGQQGSNIGLPKLVIIQSTIRDIVPAPQLCPETKNLIAQSQNEPTSKILIRSQSL